MDQASTEPGAPPREHTPVRTFLIADIRGYTHFTVERGDEAAAALAARFAAITREAVAVHGGEVTELRGDEALAVFNSTRQSLRAAAELQSRFASAMRDDPSLPLRVGIGLDAGEAIPVEGGFRGAALNLAARLCSLAGPGEILATETVVNLARKLDGLAYVDRGAAPLKGFADPVRVLRIEPAPGEESVPQAPTMPDLAPLASTSSTPGDAPPRATAAWEQFLPIGGFMGSLPDGPLVARREELGGVLAVVDTAAGQGQTVLLAGEPGAGKTRLAQEVTLRLRDRGFLIAAGRCYESEQTVPFYPFLDALAAVFEAAPRQLKQDAAHRWPYLSVLLPNHLATQEVAGGGQEEQRLFFAAASFLEAVAGHRPVAVLLDDLHWSDPASLKLLLHLARHTRSSPIFILGAYRDVEVNRRHPLEAALRDLDREGLMRRIPIRRLDQGGTAALIAATMGEDQVSSEFSELVYGRTEGNPFFVQQVMRVLVERGDVYREGERWERKSVEAIEVPESVRSVIGQRLERLSELTQEILAEASVLGQTFGFEELVGIGDQVSQRSESDVERALDEAEGIGVVREMGRDVYGFDHALTQQALYGELSSRRRRRLHAAAGAAIEALPERQRRGTTAELAWHFSEADELPKAARYSVAAAEEAKVAFAHDDAEAHFRSTLEMAAEIDDRSLQARALSGLGGVLGAMGRYGEALDVLIPAASLCRELGDREAEMRAEAEIGRIYLSLGEATTGIRRLQAALDQASERGDVVEGSSALAAATSIVARLYWVRGDYDPALAASTRAAELARAAGDNRVLAEAETRRGTILRSIGEPDDAQAVLDAALVIAEEADALDVVMTAANNTMVEFYLRGEWDKAERYQRRAIAAGERAGEPDSLSFMLRGLAWILTWRGSWREARECAERALRLSDTVGDSWHRPYVLTSLANLNMLEGRWDEATAQFDEAARSARARDDLNALSSNVWTEGELSALRGQPEKVIEQAESLLDNPRLDLMYQNGLRYIIARALIEIGDHQRAEALARQAVESAEQAGHLYSTALELIPFGCALAGQGRAVEAGEAFENAIALSRAMPMPLNEAQAQYEWGRILARTGDVVDARERLEAALAIFQQLGAVPYVERAKRALSSLEASEESAG